MPKDKEPVAEIEETQSDFDMDAATADISSSLFGQGDDEDVDGEAGKPAAPTEGEEVPASDPEAATVEPSPQPVEGGVEGETSAEVQEVGAPKTWTKAALEKWATADPIIQAEVIKREEDFLRGITQYKAAAEIGQSYDAVIEPYKPILAAENIDPVQMFQSFAANHYLLTRGTPQQKVELAAAMLSGYQIPLPDLLNFMADNLNEPVDPQVTALQREVGDLRNLIQTAQRTSQSEAQSFISREIEAFAADPAHPYFDELAADIGKLFESGLAKDLPEAYDKAVFANPTTRRKEIDRLTAESASTSAAGAQARKNKIARSTADSVTLTPKSRDGTIPVGSMDDTLAETMAAIESRG